MMNNPFQMPLLNSKAQKFIAEETLPGFNNKIELLEDKTKERDPKKLCGSKHAVWVGIEPPAKPDKIIPFKNNIVIAFWANDTSGGGILDPGAIIGGITTLVTDPDEYKDTIDAGLQAVWERDNDSIGDYAEAWGYTILYKGIGEPFSNTSKVVNAGWDYVSDCDERWWCAESYETDTDFVGLDYHNKVANAHTISIKITNEYKGVLRTVHDTTLAGTTEVYGSAQNPMPALAYFTIDSPGVWRVRVKSKASGSCADPRLDINERFTVPTPEGWGQTDSPSESQITPAAPVEITTQTSTVEVAEKTGTTPLVLLGATIGVGGLLAYALLR